MYIPACMLLTVNSEQHANIQAFIMCVCAMKYMGAYMYEHDIHALEIAMYYW